MDDNNENMFMLTFITYTYEIFYSVQDIYINCIRYMNLMYNGCMSLLVTPLFLAAAGEGTLHRTETYKAYFLSLVGPLQA